MNNKSIAQEILREAQRFQFLYADEKKQPLEFIPMLVEELGEVAKEAHQASYFHNVEELQNHHLQKYRKELIDVAAMALIAIAILDEQSEGIFVPIQHPQS